MTRILVLSATVLLALAVPASALSGGETPLPASKAAKQVKQRANAHLKFLRQTLKQGGSSFCAGVDSVLDDVADDVLDPEAAVEILSGGLGGFGFSVGFLQEEVRSNLELDTNAILDCVEPTDGLPEGLNLGDCGAIDVALARADLLAEKAYAKALKKVKKALAKILKLEDYRAGITAQPPKIAAIAPNPSPNQAGLAQPARKATEIAFKSGGNKQGVTNDGRLCIGGTADPANGATLDVTITAPNGTTFTNTGVPILTNCQWTTCFGDLPEGNYHIAVTHGSYTITSKHGV